jgi:hypothetical protein
MIRDIDPTVKSTTRGYIVTSSPTATQHIGVFFNASAILSKTVGYIFLDHYIAVFVRQ